MSHAKCARQDQACAPDPMAEGGHRKGDQSHAVPQAPLHCGEFMLLLRVTKAAREIGHIKSLRHAFIVVSSCSSG
eukprot:1159162-Pelagomonas_calceolata.AAC.8